MTKKWLTVVIVGMLMASINIYAKDLTITVDLKEVTTDVAPEVVNNETFVPISFVAQQLGCDSVKWVSPSVFITKGDAEITCTVGNTQATKNNNSMALTQAPYLSNGRTLVPLRFISEALDARVEYNAEFKTINIVSLKMLEDELKEEIENKKDTLEETEENIINMIVDKGTGKYICQSGELKEEPIYIGKILVYSPSTQIWSKINAEDDFRVGADNGTIFAEKSGAGGSKILDLANQQLIDQMRYDASYDKKWEITRMRAYPSTGNFCEVLFIRNTNTGEIQQFYKSAAYAATRWLKDNTLLIGVINPKTNKDELVIYNPEAKTTKFIDNARSGDYSVLQNKVLYHANNAEKVYDVATGKITIVTAVQVEAFLKKMYKENKQNDDYQEMPKPENLDVESLPNEKFKEVTKNAALIKIGSQTVGVYFAYEAEGDTYVPIKDVITLTGMKINSLTKSQKELVLKDKKQVIENADDTIFEERLYVSKRTLEKLGIIMDITYIKIASLYQSK